MHKLKFSKLYIFQKNSPRIYVCEKKIVLLLKQIKKTEVLCFLSEENDHLDAYLEVHAGAGGGVWRGAQVPDGAQVPGGAQMPEHLTIGTNKAFENNYPFPYKKWKFGATMRARNRVAAQGFGLPMLVASVPTGRHFSDVSGRAHLPR